MTLLERYLRSRSLGSLIRCIALDETKLSEKGLCIWSVVDVDSRELLALEAPM
jgi:hypothetical protein